MDDDAKMMDTAVDQSDSEAPGIDNMFYNTFGRLKEQFLEDCVLRLTTRITLPLLQKAELHLVLRRQTRYRPPIHPL